MHWINHCLAARMLYSFICYNDSYMKSLPWKKQSCKPSHHLVYLLNHAVLLYLSFPYSINQCFAATMVYSFISHNDFIYEITVYAAGKCPSKHLENVNICLSWQW